MGYFFISKVPISFLVGANVQAKTLAARGRGTHSRYGDGLDGYRSEFAKK